MRKDRANEHLGHTTKYEKGARLWPLKLISQIFDLIIMYNILLAIESNIESRTKLSQGIAAGHAGVPYDVGQDPSEGDGDASLDCCCRNCGHPPISEGSGQPSPWQAPLRQR